MRDLTTKVRRIFGSSTDNVLAKLVALSILGRAGYLIVGFVGSVALARFLGPANRGLLGLMISVSSLVLVFVTLGVPLSVVFYAARSDSDQGALLGNSLLQALLLTLVLVPLAAVFYPQIADAFGHGQGGATWILVAALVPISFLEWTTHGQLLGLLMFARSNALMVISRMVYVVGLLALVGFLSAGVAGGVIATAIGSVAMILGSLRPIMRRTRVRLDRAIGSQTIRYGLRVQIGSIFQLTNGRLDVIVMQLFQPLAQVGYYVVAETIAELVLNLATAFQASVMPLISSYEADHRAERASIDSVRHHGILAGIAVIGNAVFGSLIIYFAFGPDFRRAIPPMLILLPGVWFLGMGMVIQGDLAGRGRPGLSSTLAGVAAAVTVILDFALIPPLGMYGGAIASDAAYSTFGIASLIALSRVSGISVRDLIVPTRADAQAYKAVLGRAYRALRPHRGEPVEPADQRQ
jgi:O-antigen/teichoic acid export membrane protein